MVSELESATRLASSKIDSYYSLRGKFDIWMVAGDDVAGSSTVWGKKGRRQDRVRETEGKKRDIVTCFELAPDLWARFRKTASMSETMHVLRDVSKALTFHHARKVGQWEELV